MNFSHLDEKELNLFSNIHQQILPRRTERYKTLKIKEKDKINIDLNPIIDKSIETLDKFEYFNYNKNKRFSSLYNFILY